MKNLALILASSASIFCACTVWALDIYAPRETVLVAQEDDCPYAYGVLALDAVARVDAGHVACMYR
jgi:hypothetical protein